MVEEPWAGKAPSRRRGRSNPWGRQGTGGRSWWPFSGAHLSRVTQKPLSPVPKERPRVSGVTGSAGESTGASPRGLVAPGNDHLLVPMSATLPRSCSGMRRADWTRASQGPPRTWTCEHGPSHAVRDGINGKGLKCRNYPGLSKWAHSHRASPQKWSSPSWLGAETELGPRGRAKGQQATSQGGRGGREPRKAGRLWKWEKGRKQSLPQSLQEGPQPHGCPDFSPQGPMLTPAPENRKTSEHPRPHCKPRSWCHLALPHEATPLLGARPSPVPPPLTTPSKHTPTGIKRHLPHLTSLLKGVFLQTVLPNLPTQPKTGPDPHRTLTLGTHASPARCLLHPDTLSFRAYCLLSTDWTLSTTRRIFQGFSHSLLPETLPGRHNDHPIIFKMRS